ncbi:phage tail tape measure protein [Neisseriaceae bacterium B1]
MSNQNLVLNIIMKASDKASTAFTRMKAAASGVHNQLGKLQQELSDVERAQKMLVQRNNLEAEMRKNSQAIIENRKQIKAYRDEIAKAGVPTKAQTAELAKLTTQSEKLKTKQAQHGAQLEKLNGSLKSFGIQARNAGQAQMQLNQRHDAAVSAIKKEQAAVEKLERARAKINAAPIKSAALFGTSMAVRGQAQNIGQGLAAPVKAYAETETAGMDLRMAMMDKAGKVLPEYEKVNELATRLGDKLPGTTAEFKNLMTMLLRQGVSVDNVLGGTGESAALLAVQLKKTPEAAAEMAAKLQDATRATEKEMLGLMDSVQRLYYSGVDDSNILGAFSALSPALDITKMKGEAAIKTFSPLIGMLDQAGLSGESAGNALRKVFSLAMDTKKIAKATKGTGIELDFTNGKGEFGGIEQMYTELAKLQKLNTVQRLKILKEIFGDDKETLQALNTMMDKGQAGYNDFAQKMANQASLNQRVNEQLSTLTNLWDAATGTFINFTASMGESIAPELKAATQWIGEINQKLSIWAANNPKTAASLMKIAAAVGILLAAGAAMTSVLAALLLPVTALNFGWASLATSFSSGIGIFTRLAGGLRILGTALLTFGRVAMTFLFTNPFGWAILAVGALILLWRNWDKVKAAIIAGWNMIRATLRNNPFLAALGGPIGLIASLIANWDRLKATVANAWTVIRGMLRNNPFLAALSGPIGLIASLIANFDRLIGKVQQAKAAMANFSVAKAASGAWGKIKSMAGFATGGYTGHGGVNDVAGIVHKGEVVFNQADVARFGGWQALERLRTTGLTGAVLERANRFLQGSKTPSPRNSIRPFIPTFRQPERMAMAGGDNITIHVHAAPNQSAQDIAAAVKREWERLQAARQRRANSSLRDKD